MSNFDIQAYNNALNSGNVAQAYNMILNNPSANQSLAEGGTITPSTIDNSVNTITGGGANSSTDNINNPLVNLQPVTFNPSDFQVPDVNGIFQKAYDTLAPYYTQLLQEAQGDYNTAIGFLQRDYQTGVRYANQSEQLIEQQTKDSLEGALQQLGIQTTQEQQSLLDTLNKRGIALTEQNPSGGKGSLAYGTEGQAGFEKSQEDQSVALRQEALQRNAAQTIQSAQQKQQQTVEQAGNTLQEQQTAAQQSLRNQQEQLYQQRKQEALQTATLQQNQQLAQQSLNVQQKQLASQYGTSGGGGDTELQQLEKIAATPGGLNPVQRTRLNQLKAQGG